jgi:conjugal transfer pilus assembly protein TraK
MRPRTPWLLPALISSALPAYALQTIEATDGVSVQAPIALKETTRIRVDGAPITGVVGNIYWLSPSCSSPGAVSAAGVAGQGNPVPPTTIPGGEIQIECDRERGELFVKPVGNATKPINLFVSTAKATYALILNRVDTPSDTIVIRDPAQRRSASSEVRTAPGHAPTHYAALRSMLLVMASDRIPSDIRVEEVNQPVELWAESKFTKTRIYEGRDLVGEKYLLTNVSGQPMTLAEQEFDREGTQVLAVAVENHNLREGESTNVFVIRQSGRD